MSNFKSNLYPFLFALLAALLAILVQNSLVNYIIPTLIGLSALILLLFFGEPIFRYLVSLIKQKVFTPFIYDNIHTTLEFIDESGKIVSHYTTVNISQLVWWKKSTKFKIFIEKETQGTIKPEEGIGANVELYSQSEKELKYDVKFQKNNVFKKQHYYSSSCVFHNVFDQKESNFWDIPSNHFCKFYKFKLILPNSNRIIKYKVQKKLRKDYKAGEWIDLDDPNITTFVRYGKRVASIVLVKIDNSEVYRIKWIFGD